LGQTESGNSDLELKLRDFVAKIERKECVKGLKIAPADKIDALGSSVKTNCKRKNPSQKVEVQEAGFTKTGCSSSTSLLEMQDQRGQEASKLQIMEGGKSQAKDIQKVEVATIGKNSILNVSLKPQKQKGKRKIKLDTPQFQEPAFPFIRVVSDSSISKSKSKQKSGVSTDIVVFNQSLSRKVPKRLIHSGQCEAKEQSVAHDDGKSFVSGTRKKRRRTNFPSTLKIEDSAVHMEVSNLPGNANDNGSKENLQIIKFYSDDDSQSKALVLYDNSQSQALVPYDDSQSMASVPLPYTGIELMKLKLIDLRAIAKEQKLIKYHKLPKQVLVKLLVDHLGIHSCQCEAKEQSVAHDDSKSFVSGTRKKRRRTNFPSTLKIEDSAVHMELSNLPGNATDNGSKENLQIIKFYSNDDSQSKALVLHDNSQSKALVPYDDSQSTASVPLPYKGIDLMKLKLIDLRTIAKEQKLMEYHKLPKQVLVKQLVDHLGGLGYC
jgi:purine-nucleoside phosphorylase